MGEQSQGEGGREIDYLSKSKIQINRQGKREQQNRESDNRQR